MGFSKERLTTPTTLQNIELSNPLKPADQAVRSKTNQVQQAPQKNWPQASASRDINSAWQNHDQDVRQQMWKQERGSIESAVEQWTWTLSEDQQEKATEMG